MTQTTTLAQDLSATDQTITLASGTITVGQMIALDSEYLVILKKLNTTQAIVQRGANASLASAHASGTTVTLGDPSDFITGNQFLPPFGENTTVLTANGPEAPATFQPSGGGGGGAPADATYVVMSLNPTLTNERVLTAGSNITITDGGAGGTVTIASTASGSGTVTNTGTLTANHLILGNGGVDVTALGSLGTTTTVLHGNAAGAPSFGAVAISTDVSGLGSGVATFLGTPSSANLASAVTDETGSGSLVFGTGPTVSLASASTAVTQSPGDNSTKIATTAYVDAHGGTGDVVGPGSATDNALARFDGTTGKLIQDSSITLSDAGILTRAGTIEFDVSGFDVESTGFVYMQGAVGNIYNDGSGDWTVENNFAALVSLSAPRVWIAEGLAGNGKEFDLTKTIATTPGGDRLSALFSNVVTATDGTTADVYAPLYVNAFFGAGGVASKGFLQAANFVVFIQGSGDAGNQFSSDLSTMRVDLGTGYTQSTGPTGQFWLKDWDILGPVGVQPHLLDGLTLITNNYYNGSPVDGPSGGIWIGTERTAGGNMDSGHSTASSYPIDVGLGIVGKSSAGTNNIGFTTAIRIGGAGTGWSIPSTAVGTGVEVRDYVTRGIYLHTPVGTPTADIEATGHSIFGDLLITSATPNIITASGQTNTGYLQLNGKTSGALKILPVDAAGQIVTVSLAAQTVGSATLTIPDMANVNKTVAWLESPTFTGVPAAPTAAGGTNTTQIATTAFVTSAGGSFATKALDNLASVSINTSLLAQTGVDLGSTTKPFRNAFLFGGGTYGTTYLELTGTPTSTRVLTLPDATDTLVGKATTDTFTNKTYDTAGTGNVFKINGTTISAVTGSGAVALATSPAFTTPDLGTPSAGTLTNTTGFPVANLSGAGTGVLTFLATPSGANLLSALTTKTGTGVPMFGTSPTITTSLLFTGTTSGTLTVAASAVTGTNTVTFPAATGTLPIIIASSGTASSTTNSATEANLSVATIPAGIMGTNGRLMIEVLYKYVGTAGTKTPTIRHSTSSGDTSAGTILFQNATASATLGSALQKGLWNTNSASGQITQTVAATGFSGNQAAILVTGSINTGNISYINFNAQTANSGDTAQVVGYTLTLYPGV